MIPSALIASRILMACSLAAAYGLAELWVPAAAALLMSVPLILGRRRSPIRLAWVTAGMYVAGAAVGAWLDLNAWLLLISVIANLSAWDLYSFARQLETVDVVEQAGVLSQRHLRRLLIVDGLGFLSAGLALTVQLRVGFGLALILAVVALVAVSRVIHFLRHSAG